MTIRAIEHVGITVPDLEQATTFFADAFGSSSRLIRPASVAADLLIFDDGSCRS